MNTTPPRALYPKESQGSSYKGRFLGPSGSTGLAPAFIKILRDLYAHIRLRNTILEHQSPKYSCRICARSEKPLLYSNFVFSYKTPVQFNHYLLIDNSMTHTVLGLKDQVVKTPKVAPAFHSWIYNPAGINRQR